MSRTNVVAVVVAYNRQELLRRCLDGLAGQTAPPAGTVVVDNASTDASARVAAGHPLGAHVVSLPVNTGGAGGFAAGIARALTRFPQAEWIWLMDDDTIPTATALEALVGAAAAYPGSPALLASRAVWADGTEHPMNRPRTRPGLPALLHRHAALAGARQIRTASFVSILIDARAVREVGLPRASYFLWNDDFEYTSRILRGRIGLYVPDSVVRHLTRALGSSDADPGERFRFEVRNKIWTFRDCEGLGPIERAAYEAATARRWLRAAASSADRATLWRAGREGLREGLARPADNMTIFLGTPVQDDVAAVEAAARASAGPTSPSPGSPSPATADPAGTPAPPFSVLLPVYRASAVRAAGGYEPLDLMEDYWLFARMIRDGVRATNVPDVLVRYRVGAGAYARRGGGRLLHSELELQARMHRAGITTTAQYVRNIAVRAGYRLVPTGVRRTAYRTAQRALLKRTR